MFERFAAIPLVPAPNGSVLIYSLVVVLGVLVLALGTMVALLRRNTRVQIGPLTIEPSKPAERVPNGGDTTGPYRLPTFAPDPTEPFDMAQINDAMRSSETLKAIEALRSAEAKLAQENLERAKARKISGVASIRMRVCPLCLLYEVSGSSPKCHIVPSDLRELEVGRSSEGQIRTNQPNVSLRHFKLHIVPQGTSGRWAGYTVHLEDCGSRNGTWVNGKRAGKGERIQLQDGDIIEAASLRYLFYHVLRNES